MMIDIKNIVIKNLMVAGLLTIPAAMWAYTLESPGKIVSLNADVKDGVPVYSISYKNKQIGRAHV